MKPLPSIAPQVITALDPNVLYQIKVLSGAAEDLVSQRELRTRYETNRGIKTWAAWFLLKAFTTSGEIKNWRNQRELIYAFLQLNERTFYRRLEEMEALGLVTIKGTHLCLISYEKAAEILNIPYSGTTIIHFNPIKYAGKQVFQYVLRGEEFKTAKERQFDGLHFHLDKNPPLKNSLHVLLVKAGADDQRLYKDRHYFTERLLQLQMQLFKEGSDIWDIVFAHRADINRSVTSIQRAHAYKAMQSVSYCKQRMATLGIITIDKKRVESKARSRLYVPDGERRRDGYKWNGVTKCTVWFLCDQIHFTYATTAPKKPAPRPAKAA